MAKVADMSARTPVYTDVLYLSASDGSADGKATVGVLGALSGASGLSAAPSATDTTIDVTGLPDGVAANQVWVIIDPYTVQCEARLVTSISTLQLTVAALSFAHAVDDPVLFVSAPVLFADWFAGDIAAAVLEASVSGINRVMLNPGVTYSISSTINVPTEVVLDGGGGNQTSAAAAASNQRAIIQASGAMAALVDLADYSGVVNCYLDGNSNATIGVQCVAASGIHISPLIEGNFIQSVATGIKLGGATFGSIRRNTFNDITAIGLDALASYGAQTYGGNHILLENNEWKGTTHFLRLEGIFICLADDFEGAASTATIELAGSNVSRLSLINTYAEAIDNDFLRCSVSGSRIKIRDGFFDGAGLGGEVFCNFASPPGVFDMRAEVQQFETIFSGTIPTGKFLIDGSEFTTYTTFGVNAMTLYAVGYARGMNIKVAGQLMYDGDWKEWTDATVANFDCMLAKFHYMNLTGAATINPSTSATPLIRGHQFTIHFDGNTTLAHHASTGNRFRLQKAANATPAAGDAVQFILDSGNGAREIGDFTARM